MRGESDLEIVSKNVLNLNEIVILYGGLHMTRLDLVRERYERRDLSMAEIDITILLAEINERDVLLSDFREQIKNKDERIIHLETKLKTK